MHLLNLRLRGIQAGLLALFVLIFAIGLTIKSPPGFGATQSSGSFCSISSALDVTKRLGEKPPASGIKLVVSDDRVEPGDVVAARLLNFGEEVATFGAEFKIQRRGPAGWEPDPNSPNGPWKMSLGKLRPDEAGPCYRFSVPPDQPEGRFRFLKKLASRSVHFRRTAEFSIG